MPDYSREIREKPSYMRGVCRVLRKTAAEVNGVAVHWRREKGEGLPSYLARLVDRGGRHDCKWVFLGDVECELREQIEIEHPELRGKSGYIDVVERWDAARSPSLSDIEKLIERAADRVKARADGGAE